MARPDARPYVPQTEDPNYKAVAEQIKKAKDILWITIKKLSYRPDSTDLDGLKFPHGTSLPKLRDVDLEVYMAAGANSALATITAGDYALGMRELHGFGIRTIDGQNTLSPTIAGEITVRGGLLCGFKKGDELNLGLGTGWYLVIQLKDKTCVAPVNRILKTSLRVVKKPK